MIAGPGPDTAVGQEQRDVVLGGPGSDICLSGIDDRPGDRVLGGPGNDHGDADPGDITSTIEDLVDFLCYGA